MGSIILGERRKKVNPETLLPDPEFLIIIKLGCEDQVVF